MVERVLEQAAGDLALELNPDPAPNPNQSQAHPGVLGAMATRPVNSAGAVRILETGLAVMTSQDVPLTLAMDTLNAVMMFVIGHTLAEAGQTPGHEGTEPGPPAPDPAAYPNFAAAVRTGAGLDFTARFRRTLDILIDGYAAAAGQLPGANRPSTIIATE